MPPTPQSPLRIAAIVCAAGSGSRFGLNAGSKLDQDLHGKPVLVRAAEAIARQPEVVATIVAGPADPELMEAFRQRHGDAIARLGATILPGGVRERFETVKAGLDALTGLHPDVDAVLVHDAARPCVPAEVVRRVIAALRSHAAVAPAIAVADTLKRAEATQDPRRVLETVDRAGLFACQTPQGFHINLLARAYAQAHLASTDDAQLVERLGVEVVLVEGDPRNVKITRPGDLELARAIWPTLVVDRD
jgi:2-C-methyl-D-erythritol 4-phosphate cytidylyltransferase